MTVIYHQDIEVFVTMRVADLAGPALDYAVAKAEGLFEKKVNICGSPVDAIHFQTAHPEPLVWMEPSLPWAFAPSTNDAIGGPIIDRLLIATVPTGPGEWAAQTAGDFDGEWSSWGEDPDATGTTRLIAAMRAYVKLEFGATVAVPAFLVPSALA